LNKHFHRLQLAAGDFASIQFMPLIPVFTVQGTLLIRFLLIAAHNGSRQLHRQKRSRAGNAAAVTEP